jgi:hypothetical protein
MATQIAANVLGSMNGATRNVFTLSNGNCMAVVLEGTNVKIYETSAADRKTGWTQRASVSVSAAFTSASTIYGVTGALFSDNSMGVAVAGYDGTNRKVVYFKLTYAGYSASAVETVTTTALTNSIAMNNAAAFDIDVSDAGVVTLVLMFKDNAAGGVVKMRLKARHTGGSWGADQDTQVEVGGNSQLYWNASIVAMNVSGGLRACVIATSAPYMSGSSAIDPGVKVWSSRVTETTGAWSVTTHRITNTFAPVSSTISNIISHGGRNLKLFRTSAANDFHLGMIQAGLQPYNTDMVAKYQRGSWDGTSFGLYGTVQTAFFSGELEKGVS